MMKNKIGNNRLHSEIFSEADEPYLISTIKNDGNLYNIHIYSISLSDLITSGETNSIQLNL